MIAFGLTFAAIRIWMLADVPVQVFPDTPTYSEVNFLGGATRLWTVPLIWMLVPGSSLDTWAQVLLGVAAWLTLAVALFRVVANRRLALIAFATVLLVGLCVQTMEWDRVLLSESISLTLLLLVIAGVLTLAGRYSRGVAYCSSSPRRSGSSRDRAMHSCLSSSLSRSSSG
jgi:hypothetical protein